MPCNYYGFTAMAPRPGIWAMGLWMDLAGKFVEEPADSCTVSPGNRQFFASKEWRMLADNRKAWIFPPRRQTTRTFIFKPCCTEYVMR